MQLDPKQGVNPRMAMCPRCGGDNGELVLIGAHKRKGRCQECGAMVYGLGEHGTCRKPQLKDVEEIGEHERVPTSLCKPCEVETAEHRAVVAAGGVYWRCDKGHGGVIKPNAFTMAARNDAKCPAPAPIGVLLTADQCPKCSR